MELGFTNRKYLHDEGLFSPVLPRLYPPNPYKPPAPVSRQEDIPPGVSYSVWQKVEYIWTQLEYFYETYFYTLGDIELYCLILQHYLEQALLSEADSQSQGIRRIDANNLLTQIKECQNWIDRCFVCINTFHDFTADFPKLTKGQMASELISHPVEVNPRTFVANMRAAFDWTIHQARAVFWKHRIPVSYFQGPTVYNLAVTEDLGLGSTRLGNLNDNGAAVMHVRGGPLYLLEFLWNMNPSMSLAPHWLNICRRSWKDKYVVADQFSIHFTFRDDRARWWQCEFAALDERMRQFEREIRALAPFLRLALLATERRLDALDKATSDAVEDFITDGAVVMWPHCWKSPWFRLMVFLKEHS